MNTEAIRADVERMQPMTLQDVWRRLRGGLDPRPYEIVEEIAEQNAVSQSWFYVALGIAAVAGLAAAAGVARIWTAPPAARRAPTLQT